MATDALRSLWVEPRPTNPPATSAADWALVAAFVGWAVNEAVLRDGMAPAPVLLIATLAAVAPLPWRRSHPLPAVLVAFGTLIVVDLFRMATGTQGALTSSVSATLVLTYALFRWGSGRDAVRGLLVILTWLAITFIADVTTLADTITGYAFFFFAAAPGAAVRYRARIRIRDIQEAKAREREQLARELHDVVAHHVSGIAIQAQAGRAVAATHPERAVDALATIEDAATRALTELRAIVGVLRDARHSALTPQPRMADIEQLATTGAAQPRVEVTLTGELTDLSPSVAAAVYRLAQESVTNSRRHARHATRVTVQVTGETDHVRLTVDDDGSTGSPHRSPDGYGLVGMRERVTLLGGTFAAGPIADRGWRVEANLPRAGVAR